MVIEAFKQGLLTLGESCGHYKNLHFILRDEARGYHGPMPKSLICPQLSKETKAVVKGLLPLFAYQDGPRSFQLTINPSLFF